MEKTHKDIFPSIALNMAFCSKFHLLHLNLKLNFVSSRLNGD